MYPFLSALAGERKPQGSAGSSPHHISGRSEAMLASTSQFRVGVYQDRLAAVGCSAPRSRIFTPVYVGLSILATLPKSLAETHYSSVGCLLRRPGPVDRDEPRDLGDLADLGVCQRRRFIDYALDLFRGPRRSACYSS